MFPAMARQKPRYQREEEDAARDAAARAEKPRGRISADISKQAAHTAAIGGPLFYEDTEFTCVDCGDEAVWMAEDQKWWFETAKGQIYSTAKRCANCREALRERHAGTPRRSHRDRREQSNRESDA